MHPYISVRMEVPSEILHSRILIYLSQGGIAWLTVLRTILRTSHSRNINGSEIHPPDEMVTVGTYVYPEMQINNDPKDH